MRVLGYFISAIFVLCISIAEAKTVNYDRKKAVDYASQYCGAEGSGTTYTSEAQTEKKGLDKPVGEEAPFITEVMTKEELQTYLKEKGIESAIERF